MEHAFHQIACGPSVRLSGLGNRTTAARNGARGSYNGGMVFSAAPLRVGHVFTIRIDKIISVWCGSIEIGLVAADPMIACQFPSASSIELASWVLSGDRLYIDSLSSQSENNLSERLLDDLQEGDLLGVMLTERGEMEIFVNGQSEGIAASNLPTDQVWAVVDLYGACQQITVWPAESEPTQDEDDDDESALYEPFVDTIAGSINTEFAFESQSSQTSDDDDDDDDSDDSDDAEIDIGSETELLQSSDTVRHESPTLTDETNDPLRNAEPEDDDEIESDPEVIFRMLNESANSTTPSTTAEQAAGGNEAQSVESRLEEQLDQLDFLRGFNTSTSSNDRATRRPVEAVADMLARWSSVGQSSRSRQNQDALFDSPREPTTNNESWIRELEVDQLEQLLWSEPMNIRRSQHDTRRRRHTNSNRITNQFSSRNQTENIPFHSTRGSQISVGSASRSARLHTQLRELTSTRPESAPILFSAFSTPSTWSVIATPSWSVSQATQYVPGRGVRMTRNFDQWRESFWFGITTVDPNQVTTEWVNEQFEQHNRNTLCDLLHVAVRCVPGERLQLYEQGEVVGWRMNPGSAGADTRRLLQRRGSIENVRIPPNPETMITPQIEHKFEYHIRHDQHSGERTIQISIGADAFSTHRTGRIPVTTRLPLYGFIILSGTVASCEIPRQASSNVEENSSGLWQLAHAEINRLTDHLNRPLDEMTRLTNRPGRTWSRSAFRFRESQLTQPDNRQCHYLMRSLMTYTSSFHLHTRPGLRQATAEQSTSYVIYEQHQAIVRQNKHFCISATGAQLEQLEIGFINVMDHSKETNKQLDHLCLRPLDLSQLERHLFSFTLKQGEIEQREQVKLTDATALVQLDAVFSAKVTDDRHAVLSIWCAIDENENGIWVELAKSVEPLEARRAYVGYVRVNGEHTIKLLTDEQSGKMPVFDEKVPVSTYTPFSMSGDGLFKQDQTYSSVTRLRSEELIEFEVTERNNEKWAGFELGVFWRPDQSDLVTLRNGQIGSNKLVGCQLRVGSRIGLVWRQDRVELIINAGYSITLASQAQTAPFVRVCLNGNITQMRLLPETERSRLWCPNYIDMNRPTLGMLPMRSKTRTCHHDQCSFRWDSRFKTPNVHFDKTGPNTFVVRQQHIDGSTSNHHQRQVLVAAHTEPRTIVDEHVHFEIVVKFKKLTKVKNIALSLIPRSETIVDMMSYATIDEYMKRQNPAVIVNDKTIHYKCSDFNYTNIGELDESLMALRMDHALGIYIEKGGEWLTVLQNGRQSPIIPLSSSPLAHSFHIGILIELEEHQLIQVKPLEPWQRTKVDYSFTQSTQSSTATMARSESNGSLTAETVSMDNVTDNVNPTVPFLSPDNNNMTQQQKVVRPIWLKYGEIVLPTSNIAFEMKQTRTAIGESYLVTNAIFSSVAEEIDITFERSTSQSEAAQLSSQSGFLFGVKSEMDSGTGTDKVVFAREMETSIQRPLTCMIDFSSFGKHGRCLIPDATFEYILSSFKQFTSNCIRLKLLKRGDNIFINFNFVTPEKPEDELGYHLDAQGEAWFLFCRLRTQGRIVLELGQDYVKGTIGKNGQAANNQRKRSSTVSATEQQQSCHLIRKAIELSPLKSIRPVKCYCTACYASSCGGTELKHRRGWTKLYVQEEPSKQTLHYAVVKPKQLTSSLRLRKNDFRWNTFAAVPTLTKIDVDRHEKPLFVSEYAVLESGDKVLRNIYYKC